MDLTELTRCIVASADAVGLSVYAEHMNVDAATLEWEFNCALVPEGWEPPHHIHALFEISLFPPDITQTHYGYTLYEEDGVFQPMAEPAITISLPKEITQEDVPALWEVIDKLVSSHILVQRTQSYNQGEWGESDWCINYCYMLEKEQEIFNLASYEGIFEELRGVLVLLKMKYGALSTSSDE